MLTSCQKGSILFGDLARSGPIQLNIKQCKLNFLSIRNFSDDGCLVPIGKPIEQECKNKGCALTYNEYVVYDESQIRMKYLVELDFEFDLL